jgi:hypothetical protein
MKTEMSLAVYAYNLSTWGCEERKVQGQPGLQSKTLSLKQNKTKQKTGLYV